MFKILVRNLIVLGGRVTLYTTCPKVLSQPVM